MATYRVKFYALIALVVGFAWMNHSHAAEGPAPTPTPAKRQLEEQKDQKEKKRALKNFSNSRKNSGKNQTTTEELKSDADYKSAEKFLNNWGTGKSNDPEADLKCQTRGKFVSVHYSSGDASICLPEDKDGKSNWNVPKPSKGEGTSIQVCNVSNPNPKLKAVMPAPALIFYEGDHCDTLTSIDIQERLVTSGKCKTISYDKPFKVLYSAIAADCATKNPANNTNVKPKDEWEEEYFRKQNQNNGKVPDPVTPEPTHGAGQI